MKQIKRLCAALSVTLACGMLLAAFTPANAWFGGGEEASALAAFCKNDRQGHIVTFTEQDFTGQVTGEERLSAIVVEDLPQGGSLRLAGVDVRSGEAIETERLGALCFVPELGAEVHTSFTFLPVFSRSGAGDAPVTVSINVSDTPNDAPVAQNALFETYTDLPLYGTLTCFDADGDGCTFTVESQGKRGQATVSGADFCYVPSGKSGEDRFTVVATDRYGNRSQPAQITVRLIKRHKSEQFQYADMARNTAHYAALRLRQAGVLSGESFGNEAFFAPDQPVTRAQFLTMAAVVSDLAMPTAAVATGLSDNEAIPTWARSYVAAGILSGVVKGSDDGSGNRAFGADRPITRAEAAAILDRCLALSDDGREMAFADGDTVPAWAAQSVVNTAAAGLLPVFSDNTVRPLDAVTREDAAVMLYEMLRLTEN